MHDRPAADFTGSPFDQVVRSLPGPFSRDRRLLLELGFRSQKLRDPFDDAHALEATSMSDDMIAA
jgi:hypothetical protein